MSNLIKVLILGITSNTGFRFLKLNQEFDIYGICRNWALEDKKNIFIEKNITSNYIEQIIQKIEPDVIINSISIGNIDACEDKNSLHKKINVELALEVINLAEKYNIKLISFSSSQVYDGLYGNYSEISEEKPLNQYGKEKVQYDKIARQKLSKDILIRPSTIIGYQESFQRQNPATFIIDKIKNDEELLLVDDVVTNFLFLDDLVEILYRLIKEDIVGEFNIGGCDSMNRYELGKKILTFFPKSSSKIESCDSNKFPTIAQRPLNTILDNSKIKKTVNYEFTSIDKIISRIISEYH